MIDFSKIAAAALCQAEGICCELFPGGRRDGVEFRIGSLAGDAGKSLAINLRSGRWKDFSSGDSGKDLIALWAAVHNLSMADAAKELDAKLNAGGFTQSAEAGRFAKGFKPSKWAALPFAPETPPPSELRLFRDNKWQPFPVASSWAYRDAEGRLVGYVCRVNYADGKKDTIPYSFCRQEDGTEKWVQKGFAKPKPLYNLGALLANPTAGVFIVEGEKCADALQAILKGAVAIAWPGGAQAIARHAADIDWSPLNGRKIVCLPDADSILDRNTKRLLPAIQQPGIKAMLDAEAILSGIAESVFVALPPDDWKDGYDIADAIEDGWTLERLVTHIKRRRSEAKELGVTVMAHLEALARAAQEPPVEAVNAPDVSMPTPEAKTPQIEALAAQATAITNGVASQGSDTDLDAAARLVESLGPASQTAPEGQDIIRYAKGLGWMIWDGMRWRIDDENLGMQELTKESVRKWVNYIVYCAGGDPASKAAIKAARAYEGRGHIESIVKLARSDPRIFLDGECIDADPFFINCPNGLLDLRSGELQAHDRRQFCTRVTVAEYHSDAHHPAVDTVLRTIADTCGADMPGFLARAFGMCLTGDVSADSLFLLQGEGGAGKTTLLEAMARIMGDYAVKLPFESFVLSKSGRSPGGASPDLMRLRGSRLAIAEEGDRTATLDAGRIKELTGGGEITARNLYSSYAQFKATHHLWLCSNFEPRADADDSGVWRRMVKVRFQSIPHDRRDPTIRTDLLNDPQARDALFAWAVKGCMDWLERMGGRDGLEIPQSVRALTNEYRKRLDSVGQWFEDGIETESITLGGFFTASNKDLRASYERWCDDNGAMPLGKNRFADALSSRGLVGEKTMHGRVWRGVNLKTFNSDAF